MSNTYKNARKKKEQLTNRSELFRNEDGAIDLASIMVGIIVVGMIGGVIAATVFAVIPWSQDSAAKQQIDSVVAAQSAYMGLSSTIPPSVPAGHPANSYASSTQLEEAGLLKKGPKYCTLADATGKSYTVFSRSDSGKIWAATDKKTSPEVFSGTLPTDCQFIASAATADDLDGDGIPNAVDRDANGDGIQDGYVPGGPIATLDGTSSPTSGIYYSTMVTAGGTTLTSNVSNTGGVPSRKIAMNFIVTCVKNDGSFYVKNLLGGYTASTVSYNTNFNTVPCAAGERIDEYWVKPVTQEALASGQISNPEFFGGWTFTYNGAAGGYHWSEPDGYPTNGSFVSSYVGNGGSTVYATVQNAVATPLTLASQYTMQCERPDKTTYSVNRLASYTSRSGYVEQQVLALSGCGTDRITAYSIFPVAKLGDVADRTGFNGYTMSGSKTWTETDGYQSSGKFVSSYVGNGGSTVYATFQNAVATPLTLAAQYKMQCERPDKTTYPVNRLASYTSRSGYVETQVVALTGCGTDRITSYDIFPVTTLGDVDNRTAFGGYSMAGTKSWTEADGYQTSGKFVSSYVGNGGSTVYATFQNEVAAPLTLAAQYKMQCERDDKSTYSVNRLATYTSRSGYVETQIVALTGCGTDRITSYDISPVTKLGDVDNRTAFAGYSMAGTKSWTEADGYQVSGSFVSASMTGTTVYATFRNASSAPMTLASQYTMTCEKADKSTYNVNRIIAYTSRSGWIENTQVALTGCGTDQINAYSIFPVTSLGDVANRTSFAGYTMSGTTSWTR